MTEETAISTDELGRWERHKFMVLIAITISISLALVSASLWIYNTSGAAQLDLSRPGYESARTQKVNHTKIEAFDALGPIDDASLKEFRKLLDEQLHEATAVDPFGGDVMDDDVLGIDAAPSQ